MSCRKILKFPHCVFPIRLPRSVKCSKLKKLLGLKKCNNIFIFSSNVPNKEKYVGQICALDEITYISTLMDMFLHQNTSTRFQCHVIEICSTPHCVEICNLHSTFYWHSDLREINESDLECSKMQFWHFKRQGILILVYFST